MDICQQVLCLPNPRGPQKIKVTVCIEGSPCAMELDAGSSVFIIFVETLQELCPRGGPRLRPPDYILMDFQWNRVPWTYWWSQASAPASWAFHGWPPGNSNNRSAQYREAKLPLRVQGIPSSF